MTFSDNTLATIVSNDEGMFDLNDIWRTYGLGETQRPSEWRHRFRKYFNRTGKMRVGFSIQSGKGKVFHTWATIEVLYAYAMWVDVEFYIQQEVTLTFNNTTATIISNDEGMFDLNDIWRAYDLKASQSPSQWVNKVRKTLDHSGKIKSENGGVNRGTYATLEALYAYAMWLDVEFYMIVVEAFAALTRGEAAIPVNAYRYAYLSRSNHLLKLQCTKPLNSLYAAYITH